MRLVFRLVAVLCVLGCLGGSLGGCASWRRQDVTFPYWRVVTTDFQGRWIAEYVAEGPVKKVEEGFTFVAVQKRLFSSETLEFHYPLGRPLVVGASNVVVTPTGKPLWLARIDGPSM